MDKEGRLHTSEITKVRNSLGYIVCINSTTPFSIMSLPANMAAKIMETEIENRFPEPRDRRRIKRLVIGCAEAVRWKEYVLVVNSTLW